MSIYRARLRNTSNALISGVVSFQIWGELEGIWENDSGEKDRPPF